MSATGPITDKKLFVDSPEQYKTVGSDYRKPFLSTRDDRLALLQQNLGTKYEIFQEKRILSGLDSVEKYKKLLGLPEDDPVTITEADQADIKQWVTEFLGLRSWVYPEDIVNNLKRRQEEGTTGSVVKSREKYGTPDEGADGKDQIEQITKAFQRIETRDIIQKNKIDFQKIQQKYFVGGPLSDYQEAVRQLSEYIPWRWDNGQINPQIPDLFEEFFGLRYYPWGKIQWTTQQAQPSAFFKTYPEKGTIQDVQMRAIYLDNAVDKKKDSEELYGLNVLMMPTESVRAVVGDAAEAAEAARQAALEQARIDAKRNEEYIAKEIKKEIKKETKQKKEKEKQKEAGNNINNAVQNIVKAANAALAGDEAAKQVRKNSVDNVSANTKVQEKNKPLLSDAVKANGKKSKISVRVVQQVTADLQTALQNIPLNIAPADYRKEVKKIWNILLTDADQFEYATPQNMNFRAWDDIEQDVPTLPTEMTQFFPPDADAGKAGAGRRLAAFSREAWMRGLVVVVDAFLIAQASLIIKGFRAQLTPGEPAFGSSEISKRLYLAAIVGLVTAVVDLVMVLFRLLSGKIESSLFDRFEAVHVFAVMIWNVLLGSWAISATTLGGPHRVVKQVAISAVAVWVVGIATGIAAGSWWSRFQVFDEKETFRF